MSLPINSIAETMSQYNSNFSVTSSEYYSKSSDESFYLKVGELVHERDVLLKAFGDAAENSAKLQRERDRLKAQLAESENTIATLRSKGKRVVADRDKWEEVARRWESEIAQLRILADNSVKFRQVKAVLSRRLHPDNDQGAGEIEKIARTVFFKEIWPEIVKIDRGEG
jgi:chromosome segregation ATPase